MGNAKESAKTMSREEFVELALSIVGNDMAYEDDVVIIRKNFNGLDLEVTRKPMPDVAEEFRGSNPTTMVKDGDIIRHHGEHSYLVDHMKEVAADKVGGPSF